MTQVQVSKLRWIQRCAERFLEGHPTLEPEDAIELAAQLWADCDGIESPEAAAEIEMALWEADRSAPVAPPTLH